MQALICLYLIQERFVDLNSDSSVQEVLLSYLGSVKKVREGYAPAVLGRLLERYRIPEGPWAFKKYVASAGRWLFHEDNLPDDYRTYVAPADHWLFHEDNLPDDYRKAAATKGVDREEEQTVLEVAVKFGISKTTLYNRINKGKVPFTTRGGRKLIGPDGRQAIEDWIASRRTSSAIQSLAPRWAEKRGITLANAERQVRRWQSKGLTYQQMKIKIAQSSGLSPSERQAE